MTNTIRSGKFTARVVDYGVKESKAGLPLANVRFAWKDGDQSNQYNWTGSFNEGKAREITFAALSACSVMIQEPGNLNNLVPKFSVVGVDALADGLSSDLLDTTKDVQIDVQMELGTDGKEYAKIAWVNPLGGGKFQNAMSRDDVKVKFAGMNLKADLLAARQTHGVKVDVSKPVTADDLPF